MEIPEGERIPGIEYKFIFAMDMVTQDLLGNNILENAIDYIERAVKDGASLLVHCELGVSRSIAVVIGYLMRRFEWSAKKALLFIQRSRPIAHPNASFMTQLSIFENLGFKADQETLVSSPLYRSFCADTGNVPAVYHSFRSARASTSQTSPAHAQKADLSTDIGNPSRRFTCKKCRSPLFYDTHLMHHTRGAGPCSGGAELRKTLSVDELCDYEYLIAPMKWMELSEYQGKIGCYKCGEKLGQFVWGGRKCLGDSTKPCGAHISPWVHLQKSKVDEAKMHRPSESKPAEDALSASLAQRGTDRNNDNTGTAQHSDGGTSGGLQVPTVVITS
ncbi:dual specificity phosphatase [Aphelenchoides avenae]|nr:dual specificity phosphatase [Aphelenchus avenae]